MDLKLRDMVYISMFTVILVVCSWISIPTTVPVTLQTLAVFLSAMLLGGKRATITVIVYLLLGAVGLPVFHNGLAGIGIILGNTGGYMVGFLAITLFAWIADALAPNKEWVMIGFLLLGLVVCYLFGTVWFVEVYASNAKEMSFYAALLWCVVPFVIPDIIKLGLAILLKRRLKQRISIS